MAVCTSTCSSSSFLHVDLFSCTLLFFSTPSSSFLHAPLLFCISCITLTHPLPCHTHDHHVTPTRHHATPLSHTHDHHVTQRRLILGLGFTAAAAAFALIPTEELRGKPSQPLFFYLVPVLRSLELLEDLLVQLEEGNTTGEVWLLCVYMYA